MESFTFQSQHGKGVREIGTDWEKIRQEYITGSISYRALARKYGLGESAVLMRGKRERWTAQKRAYEERLTGDTAAFGEEARRERFLSVTDRLLEKVELLTEREETLTPSNLKTLSDVMKNIKEVQMIRSRREQQELDLKLEKLRKDAGRQEIEGNTITVQLEEAEEYAR